MFLSFLAPELVDRIRRWDELKRWERKEIGQTLRKMGLSYREISAVIPVHKGTLSQWCKDLELTDEHRRRIGARRADRRDIGVTLRRRAQERELSIRQAARAEVPELVSDAFWVAGVVAYWAEGSKGSSGVRFSNSDPVLVKLFVGWAEAYLATPRSAMKIQLHLHSGQDETERKSFWSNETGIPLGNFIKTYVKPEGTGHRKNVLYNGTATVRLPKSASSLHRILG